MKIVRSEPVQLLARGHGYFPIAFRWRGRRFDVELVEKCWIVHRPGARRMFRVRCVAGRFVLEQCLASDTWQVSRWPLALWLLPPPSLAPARFPLPRRQRRPLRQLPQPRLSQTAHTTAPTPTDRRPPWRAVSPQL